MKVTYCIFRKLPEVANARQCNLGQASKKRGKFPRWKDKSAVIGKVGKTSVLPTFNKKEGSRSSALWSEGLAEQNFDFAVFLAQDTVQYV